MSSSLLYVPRATAPRSKIRVLVVDDSVVIQHLLQQALRGDDDLEFVGAASDGVAALAQIPILQPNVVTLDIEMPKMDGIETLRQIRKLYPRLRTIMFSTLTVRGGAATFEALSLGADDYVAKASNAGSLDKSLASLRTELIPKIKQFFALPGEQAKPAYTRPALVAPRGTPSRMLRPRVVAIGVSTGGPPALATIIPKIPANFPLPILIVQHMPAVFTRLLAERLQASSPLRIEEATEGMAITPGRVLLAPGGYHLRVRRADASSFVAALDQGPPENSCRPSVDVLFRSVAENYGGQAISVVLTGMGSDGLRGVEKLKGAGAIGLVQDEATSVVWGMPGAVARAGLADAVLPLSQIVPELVRRTAR